MPRSLIALLLCSLLGLSFAYGQLHRFPRNGENALPSAIPHSFLIGWSPYEGVVGYEYVVSDNPQCFIGCAGDTRLGYVPDTVAVEYNLEPDKWYYWIVRMYYADGDTSEFSSIYSFFTAQPNDLPRLLSVASNPVQASEIRFVLDWAQNADATEVQVNLYDQNGNHLRNEHYRRGLTALRFEEVVIPVADLPVGYYFVDVLVGSRQTNRNNFYTLKIMLLGYE